MDPLSDVLSLLKPSGFGFRGLDAAGDWSLAFRASEGLKVFAIEAGTCWLALDVEKTVAKLGPGDLVLLPGRTASRLYSAPEVTPIDAYRFFPTFPAGTTGTLNGGGACFGIGGFFSFAGSHAELLLGVLPPAIHLKAERTRAALGWLIHRLMDELREPQLGGALIAGHLSQMLLVEALRLHLDDQRTGSGWLSALADRQMRAAMAAMHAEPARSWSLADLARVAGMSRSSFAASFKRIVGQPPLEYLTRWRMLVAADRLMQGDAPLAALAPALGYASESAFGVAFKRVIGQSPRGLRRARSPSPRGA